MAALLNADDLVLCGGSEEDLRVMCRRRGLIVNLGKRKGIVMNGWRVYGDGIRFEHFSEFKYSRCVLGESGTDEAV